MGYSRVMFALLGYTISQIPSGSVIAKLGTRLGMLLCVAIWSAVTMLHGLAGEVVSLGVFRIAIGVAEAGNWPESVKAASENFPPHRRAFAVGVFNSGFAAEPSWLRPWLRPSSAVGLAPHVRCGRPHWILVGFDMGPPLLDPALSVGRILDEGGLGTAFDSQVSPREGCVVCFKFWDRQPHRQFGRGAARGGCSICSPSTLNFQQLSACKVFTRSSKLPPCGHLKEAEQLAALAVAGAVEFNRDIRPILSDKCFACHGPDSKNRFRFDTEAGAKQDLGGLFAIARSDRRGSLWRDRRL
jgi:MFS transporter